MKRKFDSGYYSSIVFLLILVYTLIFRLGVFFGIMELESSGPTVVSERTTYLLLTVALVITLPFLIYASPSKLLRSWSAFFGGIFISAIGGWVFSQDLGWRIVVNVVSIILMTYAFLGFKKARSRRGMK